MTRWGAGSIASTYAPCGLYQRLRWPVVNAVGDESALPTRQGRRWWRRRWGWLVGVVVLVAWASVAGLLMLNARRSADQGIVRLEAFEQEMTAAKLIRGEGLASLRKAEGDFARARSDIESPLLWSLKFVPVVGRQMRSIDALISSADTVVSAGTRAVADARREIDGKQSSGAGRVQIAERLNGIVERTNARLSTVELGPSKALVGPLASARERFAEKLDEVREALAETGEASRGMTAFLGGPTRYLVIAANNAEMRAGAGMFLSVGELVVSDGTLQIDEMRTVTDQQLPPGAVTIRDADLRARWGWIAPNQEWRNLAASPRFAASAELAVEMWKARTGRDVTGVLVLDPIALRAVLEATGPVEVEGEQISAETVVDEILHRQYLDLPPGFGDDQTARRERLSEIASAAMRGIDGQAWDVSVMVEQLQSAAKGRHVLAWSSDPAQQAAWTAAGIDGALQSNSLMASLQSQGGNKLDQFLELNGVVKSAPAPKGGRAVTLTLTIENHVPMGEPRYISGPTFQLPEGVYAGIVSVNVPGAASDLRFEGSPRLVAAGSDGPTTVIATRVLVARGQKITVVVTFVLPRGVDAVRIESSARVPTITWKAGAQVWIDDHARTVRLKEVHQDEK